MHILFNRCPNTLIPHVNTNTITMTTHNKSNNGLRSAQYVGGATMTEAAAGICLSLGLECARIFGSVTMDTNNMANNNRLITS